jgi:hypothetical protein
MRFGYNLAMICNAIREKNSSYTTTRQAEVEFCCEEMKEAWNDRFIGFGEFDSYPINRIVDVCVYRCFAYPEGAFYNEMPLKYCPFCAEEIKIVITDAPLELKANR